MTPLILIILAGMWAAVLLPPYLRDRNEIKTSGGADSVRRGFEALTSSFSGGRSHLPVRTSGQSASEVPLPHGARQAVATRSHPGAERMPQSSAVQLLDANGNRRTAEPVTPLRPVGAPAIEPEAAPVISIEAHVPTESVDAPATVAASGAAYARQRRRDVVQVLAAVAFVSFVAALGLGFAGPMLLIHLAADVALAGYVYLLVQHRKVSAEQEIKVAFLPHGGNGASATALLESGGGWNPGHSVDNIRVLQAEAN